MGDEQKPGGGAPGENGGADSKDQNKPDPKPKSVSWEDHKRSLDDMHRFKREAEEANKKLADAEQKRLQDQGEWKTLADREKQRADKLEQDNKRLADTFVRTHKYSAVKTAAMEMGLRPEAMDDLDLLDIDGVQVEATSSGRYLVNGAKEYAEELKSKKPHWFKKSGPDNVNSGTGGGAPGTPKKLTAIDLVNAEKDVKRGKLSQDGLKKMYVDYRAQQKQNK